MKAITKEREVRSSDAFIEATAKVTFKTVEDVKELINLIKNFDTVNKATGNKLFKYTVINEYAEVEIYEDEDEHRCDVNNIWGVS